VDRIRKFFEQEAQAFDRTIVKVIPHYSQMVEALVRVIPFEESAAIEVIDLGCGTGTLAECILARFPNARVTCIDLAENMIAMAQTRLGTGPEMRYVVSDFNSLELNAEYDVAVSSLALHHLATDGDKRRFYRRIYKRLNPGGVFYNADVVLGSSSSLQAVYLERWREFMGRDIPQHEIEEKWIPNYEDDDRPAKLIEQLAWLAEIGFSEVDVVWKYFNFAVYGGRKY
jgi:tRNA (cmo5U34)-methyltransferase